jgi:hypothetical protein
VSTEKSGKSFPFFWDFALETAVWLFQIGLISIENKGKFKFPSQVGTPLATMQSVAHALRSLRMEKGDLIWQQQLYLPAFAGCRRRLAIIGFWPR